MQRIELQSRRGGIGLFAVVDDTDYDFARQYSWHAYRRGWRVYAQGTINGATTYIHRLILGAVKGQTIDHVDGDGLNNCRANLRFCTVAENNRNARKRGKFKGVWWAKHANKWSAYICKGGKKHLGYFATAEDAAKAYDAAASEAFGVFACPNFPQQPKT